VELNAWIVDYERVRNTPHNTFYRDFY
jgi:hypothetical protein